MAADPAALAAATLDAAALAAFTLATAILAAAALAAVTLATATLAAAALTAAAIVPAALTTAADAAAALAAAPAATAPAAAAAAATALAPSPALAAAVTAAITAVIAYAFPATEAISDGNRTAFGLECEVPSDVVESGCSRLTMASPSTSAGFSGGRRALSAVRVPHKPRGQHALQSHRLRGPPSLWHLLGNVTRCRVLNTDPSSGQGRLV